MSRYKTGHSKLSDAPVVWEKSSRAPERTWLPEACRHFIKCSHLVMILGPLWMHSEIKFLQAEKGLWEPHVEKCICGNCTLASSEELSNNIEWTLVLEIKSVLSTVLMCNAIIATTSRKFGVRAGLCQVSFPVWWSGPPSSSFVLLRGFGLHSVLLNSVTFFFFLMKTITFHDIGGYSWMWKREELSSVQWTAVESLLPTASRLPEKCTTTPPQDDPSPGLSQNPKPN